MEKPQRCDVEKSTIGERGCWPACKTGRRRSYRWIWRMPGIRPPWRGQSPRGSPVSPTAGTRSSRRLGKIYFFKFFLKVWWPYATLFAFIFDNFSLYNRYEHSYTSFIHKHSLRLIFFSCLCAVQLWFVWRGLAGCCEAKRDVAYQSDVWHSQCCGSGSVCFWASRIRILLSSIKNCKKNLDFYCFVTSFGLFIFEKWCKCSFKKYVISRKT